MPDVWFAVPGDPETLTGGYIYAARLTTALIAAGWTVHRLTLPSGFPFPSAQDIETSRGILTRVPKTAPLLIDGLAYGALPSALLESRKNMAALVHHPLARETGLDSATAARLLISEQRALAFARAVVTTSAHTAIVLAADYGVARDRLFVALPGTDPRPRATGGGRDPCLLTVATVTPRKGHDVLIAALARLADLPWVSCLAGSLDRAPDTVTALRAQIAASGVADRITLAGEQKAEELEKLYAAADLFVLPSRYEGYGMAFAEALAHGLPIVGCCSGAVADTVPSAAAVLVPPDDAAALAEALHGLLATPALRERMAQASWSAGQVLPRWSDTAKNVIAALETMT